MSDRDDQARRPAGDNQSGERVPTGLIVVTQTPGRGSAKWLPPILILMAGTAFLAYRSARSADWRGVSAWFETDPRSVPLVVAKSNPSEAAADAPGAGAGPAPEEAVAQGPKVDNLEAPKPATEPEALADIEREAQQTREKIAELERLKEQEAKKLDETAGERQQADRLDRRFNPRFRLGRVAPEQLEKMLRAQNELLRRQMSLMAGFQRRQFDEMAAMNRQFFGNPPWNPNHNNLQGRAVVPPPPRPNPPRADFEPGQNAGENGGQVRRFPLPDGGIARLHEFDGPGGMRGFRFELHAPRFSPDDADDDVPPPPPPPRFRGRQID